jgi:hypothetical protein
VHIQILDDNGKATINDLCIALEFCLHRKIDIINLSIGSTKLSDCLRLEPTIEKLYNNGTFIVAAINNSNYKTVPASMKNVIGVARSNKALKQHNNIAPVEENYLGVDFYAEYKIPEHILSALKPLTANGNSLAVPVVTANIAKELARDPDIATANRENIISKLKQQNKATFIVNDANTSKIKKEIIMVYLVPRHKLSENNLISILNTLSCKWCIEGICLSHIRSEDIRILYIESNTKNTLDSCYSCDADILIVYDEDYIANISKTKANELAQASIKTLLIDSYSINQIALCINNSFFI